MWATHAAVEQMTLPPKPNQFEGHIVLFSFKNLFLWQTRADSSQSTQLFSDKESWLWLCRLLFPNREVGNDVHSFIMEGSISRKQDVTRSEGSIQSSAAEMQMTEMRGFLKNLWSGWIPCFSLAWGGASTAGFVCKKFQISDRMNVFTSSSRRGLNFLVFCKIIG